MADPTPDQVSARSIIADTLNQWGLGSLVDTVTNWIFVTGKTGSEAMLALKDTPEYKAQFGNVNDARVKAGLPAMTEQQILDYRSTTKQLFSAYNLPKNFYDQSAIDNLMTNNISPVEINDRIVNGFAKVQQAPPSVRDAFSSFFGAQGDGALASFFLDPEKSDSALTRMVTEAQIGGIGQQAGFGVNLGLATQLAENGVGAPQAQQGFQQLAHLKPLFDETISESQDLNPLKEGVGAVFGTDDGSGAAAIQQRQDERKAAFAGGGGALVSQTGYTGLGSAR